MVFLITATKRTMTDEETRGFNMETLRMHSHPDSTQSLFEMLQWEYLYIMLRLHWTTFSLRPYHVLKIQERGEDGVKLKQFRISKFPLRPYYVPGTSLLRPHHVLTTSFTFPLRPQYALTKFIPFPLRPCYVLTKTKLFNHARTTFPARSKCKYINQSDKLRNSLKLQ